MATSPTDRLSLPLDTGRDAFLAQTSRFVTAVERLSDLELLSPSRCHGWAVLEVVVHVRAGLEEMLRGACSPTSAEPTVDAATYWSSWASEDHPDEVDGILWTRRTATAYGAPSGAVRHLRAAADAVTDAARRMADRPVAFQGQVLTAGDFLGSWAVELAVHHLDAGLAVDLGPVEPTALHLARRTVEALLGREVGADVADVDVVLAGAGRVDQADDEGPVRAVLG